MSRPITTTDETYRSFSFKLIKWVLIAFTILNILSSIWVGIYLNQAVKEAAAEYPDEVYGNHSEESRNKAAKVWKGIIIALLVIIDLVNLMGLIGAIKEHYWLCMVFGIILATYSLFTAAVYYTRGSYSSWLTSFGVSILAFVYAHKIRVEVIAPTIYTAPPKV